jgi:hypothetical protein
MSSSRSIAAARNRRVNEAPKRPEPPKPPPSFQSQQQQQQQTQQGQSQVPFSRISVSDAIGLITIRLGRVEQLLQKTDLTNISSKPLELPPNSQIVDNSVFQTILSRLDLLEKRDADLKKELVGEMTTLVSEFRSIVDTRFQEIDDAFVELESHLVIADEGVSASDGISDGISGSDETNEEQNDIELTIEEQSNE